MLLKEDETKIRQIFREELGYLASGLQKDRDSILETLGKMKSQLDVIESKM